MGNIYSLSDIRHTLTIFARSAFPAPDILDNSIYTIEDIVDQVIFEMIKLEYERTAPKKSLRQHFIDNEMSLDDFETENRRFSRRLEYVQHYRNLQNFFFEDNLGIHLTELEPKDFSDNSSRFQGHSLNNVDFWECKAMNDCQLLKNIVQKQITSADKISNTEFKIRHNVYSYMVKALEPDKSQPDKIIENSVAMFRLEWKYAVDFLYNLSMCAEQHIRFKDSASKFNEQLYFRCKTLVASTPLPTCDWCPGDLAYIDQRFLMKRDNYCDKIFTLNDSEWEKERNIICCALQLYSLLKYNNSLKKIYKAIIDCQIQEKSDFILSHYWLWDKHPDYVWTPKSIKYYRNFRDALTIDQPKPTID